MYTSGLSYRSPRLSLTNRLTLAYKGLPHKTEWIEFPDIEPLCKKLGLPPTRFSPSGSPVYTIPLIYDPNTKKHVLESVAIAKYLDETYPETPQLLPPGTDAFQAVFLDMAWPSIALPLYFSIMEPAARMLNPRSEEFFRRTREETFGKKVEELATEEQWQAFRKGLGALKQALDSNGPASGGLLMSDKVTFADLVIASFLVWARTVAAETWVKIVGLHDGAWEKFLDRFAQYTTVIA